MVTEHWKLVPEFDSIKHHVFNSEGAAKGIDCLRPFYESSKDRELIVAKDLFICILHSTIHNSDWISSDNFFPSQISILINLKIV